jgi:hypothetical protein
LVIYKDRSIIYDGMINGFHMAIDGLEGVTDKYEGEARTVYAGLGGDFELTIPDRLILSLYFRSGERLCFYRGEMLNQAKSSHV